VFTSDTHAAFANKRFLIIDDFQGMRSMFREMLKSCGAKDIDAASNGAEAISILEKNKYDVVLCDYNLGLGRNGQQVMEEAKFRNLIGLATAWVVVSAEKTAEMVIGAAEYVPDDYIVKPVNEATVRARLSKVMDRKAALLDIEKAVKAKDHKQAIALCDQKLSERSGYTSDLLRMKTTLLLQSGQRDKAKAVFEQILTQRDIPWAKTGLAKIHLLNKEYDEARRLLNEVVEESRTYLEGYDLLAKMLEEVGELDEAQYVLTRSAELSPNSLSRQRSLGEIAQKRGDLDVAEKAFRKTISLGENSILKTPSAYLGLAKVCSEKGNASEAVRLLGEVHKTFDDQEATLHAKIIEGAVYSKSGDLNNARKLAAEVATIMRESAARLPAQVTLEAADLIMGTGDKDTAAELLKVVVKNNHENEDLIGQVKGVFAKGNMEEQGGVMVEDMRREVVQTNNKAVSLAKEGKLEEAVSLMRNAKGMMPNNKRVLLNLTYAMILLLKKNGREAALEREARDCLDRIQKLDPGEKLCADYRAMIEEIAAAG
jgi:tetratricopeptide (TPR) repeat protein